PRTQPRARPRDESLAAAVAVAVERGQVMVRVTEAAAGSEVPCERPVYGDREAVGLVTAHTLIVFETHGVDYRQRRGGKAHRLSQRVHAFEGRPVSRERDLISRRSSFVFPERKPLLNEDL